MKYTKTCDLHVAPKTCASSCDLCTTCGRLRFLKKLSLADEKILLTEYCERLKRRVAEQNNAKMVALPKSEFERAAYYAYHTPYMKRKLVALQNDINNPETINLTE